MEHTLWAFTEKGQSLRRAWPMVVTGKLYMPEELCFLADRFESLACGECTIGTPMLKQLEKEGYVRIVLLEEVQSDAVKEAGNIVSKETDNGQN